MTTPEWKETPERTTADSVHALVKASLSLGLKGLGGELFAFLIRAPFERRLEIWIPIVEMKLRHLASLQSSLIDRLANDEAFADILIAATQAAARTSDNEKRRMLASAVEQSARQVDVDADFQRLFVRFVDELTPSHIDLLSVLDRDGAQASSLTTFDDLRQFYIQRSPNAPTHDEFKLLCNDLESRVLVRLSDLLDDYGQLAQGIGLSVEGNPGTTVLVTDIGRNLLRFVSLPLSNEEFDSDIGFARDTSTQEHEG